MDVRFGGAWWNQVAGHGGSGAWGWPCMVVVHGGGGGTRTLWWCMETVQGGGDGAWLWYILVVHRDCMVVISVHDGGGDGYFFFFFSPIVGDNQQWRWIFVVVMTRMRTARKLYLLHWNPVICQTSMYSRFTCFKYKSVDNLKEVNDKLTRRWCN